MRIFTVTVELKSPEPVGPEAVFAVKADTSSQAKEMVRRRYPVQYTKGSRPFDRAKDANATRIGW